MSTLHITGLEQSFHAWTDSTITLQWLSQLPRTWITFVANRVSYKQEIIKRDSWNHVPTNDNPADLASRGLSVEDTVSFLTQISQNLPILISSSELIFMNKSLETKEPKCVMVSMHAKQYSGGQSVDQILANQ